MQKGKDINIYCRSVRSWETSNTMVLDLVFLHPTPEGCDTFLAISSVPLAGRMAVILAGVEASLGVRKTPQRNPDRLPWVELIHLLFENYSASLVVMWSDSVNFII